MSLLFAWLNGRRPLLIAILLIASASGCLHHRHAKPIPSFPQPRELEKVGHPTYRVEPPDILEINSLQTIPLPPYKIRTLDTLAIRVPEAAILDKDSPIDGLYSVDPEGSVNLGDLYGRVAVVGMTLPEAKAAVKKSVGTKLKDPRVEVELADSRASQQIRGRHLIRPDGTIDLGEYGSVFVTGATIEEAKKLIEDHLGQFLKDPLVTVDVLAYNSKVYYVILDGAGNGQQLFRLPSTGNETVLDALCQVSGLTPVSDPRRIWISRPGPEGQEAVLPVDWKGTTELGQVRTNYQILPGDRIFVQGYPLVSIDTKLARVFAPIERVLGVTLLGTSTVRNLGSNNGGNGGNNVFFP
jgi:polysaccharide biosynthesis/export protein